MKAPQDIIIKPVITEKSMDELQNGKYTFKVAKNANKIEIKKAVDCGYWTLYRFNPDLAEQGKNPLTLDSKEPKIEGYQDFLKGEVRYASLAKMFPDVAEGLFEKNEADALAKYAKYKSLAE